MKKILSLIAIAVLSTMVAFAQKGEKNVGVSVAYGTRGCVKTDASSFYIVSKIKRNRNPAICGIFVF